MVDGTGKPGVRTDIAVSDGVISRIDDLCEAFAPKVINAGGLVVAPGFIDIHSHTDLLLPAVPTADSLVRQGITTAVAGQCGLSPAPLGPGDCRETAKLFGARINRIGDHMPWSQCASLGGYLQFLGQSGISINLAQLVGQGVIRGVVMGLAPGNADSGQMARMIRLAEEAMEQGAFGISTGLIYPPGSWTGKDELVKLVSVVAKKGGLYFSHIRNESDLLIESIQEALEIGRRSEAHTQVCHFKAAGRACWHKSEQGLEIISRAAESQPVGTDMYPYTSGSSSLVSLLPTWTLQGKHADLLARLADPETRGRMKDHMANGGLAMGQWEDVLIIQSASKPEFVGRRVAELAEQSGKSPGDWLCDALIETDCDPMMVVFLMSEENRRREITHPLIAIGTDGFALAKTGPTAAIATHPRSFGTFPRVLGHYCREEGLFSLEEAVRKMTGLPASYLGLKDRGLIRPGYAADITIFDPGSVKDTATYEQPKSYPEGIAYVLVGGEPVVSQGEHTGALPGRVLRPS